MGIALALGAIVGTQAVNESLLVLVVIGSLVVVAASTSSRPRVIISLMVVGILAGYVAALIQDTAAEPPLTAAPRTITARIMTDPAVNSSGNGAWVAWRDADGAERRSYALFTPSPDIMRGDIVEAVISIEGVHGERLYVRRHVVTSTAGGREHVRNVVRKKLGSIAGHRISGSPGTLTLGLLIGDDTALPADERLQLRQSGLSHITAVSGWNVTLVTGSIGAVFLAFGLRGWLWVVVQLSLMSVYVWIVGLDPPVTRAAIMAVVALSATRLGRPAHSITALSLAAGLMVMFDPQIVQSLSFQLSMLATFALIAAMRMTEQFTGWRGALGTATVASGLTGLATAPVLAATFGTLSLATVPANIVAGPIVPIASIGGVFVVILEPVPPLAALAGWVVWVIASIILVVARVSAGVPFGYTEFQPVTGAASAVVHVLVFGSVVSLTPEGRSIRRRLLHWAADEPRAALAAGAGMSATIIAGLIVI